MCYSIKVFTKVQKRRVTNDTVQSAMSICPHPSASLFDPLLLLILFNLCRQKYFVLDFSYLCTSIHSQHPSHKQRINQRFTIIIFNRAKVKKKN